jgi:hypothetical protein
MPPDADDELGPAANSAWVIPRFPVARQTRIGYSSEYPSGRSTIQRWENAPTRGTIACSSRPPARAATTRSRSILPCAASACAAPTPPAAGFSRFTRTTRPRPRPHCPPPLFPRRPPQLTGPGPSATSCQSSKPSLSPCLLHRPCLLRLLRCRPRHHRTSRTACPCCPRSLQLLSGRRRPPCRQAECSRPRCAPAGWPLPRRCLLLSLRCCSLRLNRRRRANLPLRRNLRVPSRRRLSQHRRRRPRPRLRNRPRHPSS